MIIITYPSRSNIALTLLLYLTKFFDSLASTKAKKPSHLPHNSKSISIPPLINITSNTILPTYSTVQAALNTFTSNKSADTPISTAHSSYTDSVSPHVTINQTHASSLNIIPLITHTTYHSTLNSWIKTWLFTIMTSNSY